MVALSPEPGDRCQYNKKGGDARPLFLRQAILPLLPSLLGGLLCNLLCLVLIPPFVIEVCVSGDPVCRAPVRGIKAALRFVARAGWREASRNHRSVIKTPLRDHKALVIPASLIQDVDYE